MMKQCRSRLHLFLQIFVSICLLSGCASSQEPRSILVIAELDDIPNIANRYDNQIDQLQLGMETGQVVALFPNSEKECFSDEICHYTVFEERQIILDRRLKDIDLFTKGLISALALTCLVADDTCNEVVAAAFNVSVASALEQQNIKGGGNVVAFPVLINTLNHQSLGIVNATERSPQRTKINTQEPITLIQWINVKVERGKVTEWAVNEPLEQFKPKTFDNKLPPLDEALGL